MGCGVGVSKRQSTRTFCGSCRQHSRSLGEGELWDTNEQADCDADRHPGSGAPVQ